MDKTIIISGRQVTFRKTGGTVLRYKRQFGREFLSDLEQVLVMRQAIKDTGDQAVRAQIVLRTETEWMYDMLFIMAQQADTAITDELSWLDSFEEFDVWTVFSEIMPMLIAEAKPAAKNV